MLMKRLALMLIALACGLGSLAAQSDLAATLEVLAPGVEVKRVNTDAWLEVKVEGIVGVGDEIRTNDAGRARITFFADGTDTELLANTHYRIETFAGSEAGFTLTVEVLLGQTAQRLGRILDSSSSYSIQTPSMTMAARGTTFAVRVEANGRAGMLVSEGNVAAEAAGTSADVPPAFGIRAEPEGALSDVVAATTFDQLDAALDGCFATLSTVDDVSLNVRLGPGQTRPLVGYVSATALDTLIGVSQVDGQTWYRIAFKNGFAWVRSSNAAIAEDCAGLRVFSPDHLEDAARYEGLGESIDPAALPTPAPEATASATGS